MVIKACFNNETLSTLIAGEWLLSGVNAHVIHDANFVCEGLPAQFAVKTALASVTYVGVKSTVAKSAYHTQLWASFFCKVAGTNPWSRVAVFWAYFKKYGCLLGKSDKQLRFFIYVRRILQYID